MISAKSTSVPAVTDYIERYVDPFPIIQAKPKTHCAYQDTSYKLLKPAFENDPLIFPDRHVTPPPPIDAEADRWAVETLRDHRKYRNQKQFPMG
jgi:hypothetical protein